MRGLEPRLRTHSIVATYGGDDFTSATTSPAPTQVVTTPTAPSTTTTPAPPPSSPVLAPFPADRVIIAGLEAVGNTKRATRAVSFTQRVVAAGTITCQHSWRAAPRLRFAA